MARNHENDKHVNEALDSLNRNERVQKLTRRQKVALGASGLAAFGIVTVVGQASNNEALQQEALEAADESHTSASEAETNAKRLGNELATAIEDGTVTPIVETAENGDGYSTLREAGLERMYEDGEEVKGAEDAEYSPLPIALMEELNGDFPKVGDEVIVGIVSPEDYAENFREQVEANPLEPGPR